MSTALAEQLSAVLLEPAAASALDVRGRTDAGVLVPLYVEGERLHAVFTRRRDDMRRHPGEISFPGGRHDDADPDLLATALREADEEIGLARTLVEPIGYLDLYLTFSGFRILPLVARVKPDYALTLNKDEVEDAFEVPLAFLMGPENHQKHARDWKGIVRHYYAMPYEERYIWGVTAGILRNLYERVYTG
jgi:8-oxo-dGTP pyrophosphatase MutT (NUDIX family)